MYPVDICYTKEPVANYKQSVVETVFKLHSSESFPGDFLCFLTGQDDVNEVVKMINEYAPVNNRYKGSR